MRTLEDKVAIVTGGNSGIGRAIVLALAQAGAAVTINYHSNQDAAEKLMRQVQQGGGKALIVRGDVARVADVQQLVEQTVQAFGRLDIMINNAGMETRTSVIESSERDFDLVIGVNLKGAFFWHAVRCQTDDHPRRWRANHQHLVGARGLANAGQHALLLRQGGVRMLTRTAAVELAPHGITVVGVGPGAVATPINQSTLDDPAKKAVLDRAIPLGRIAQPEEIANLVAWLASDQSAYVTATTYFIDGGIMRNSVGL